MPSTPRANSRAVLCSSAAPFSEWRLVRAYGDQRNTRPKPWWESAWQHPVLRALTQSQRTAAPRTEENLCPLRRPYPDACPGCPDCPTP